MARLSASYFPQYANKGALVALPQTKVLGCCHQPLINACYYLCWSACVYFRSTKSLSSLWAAALIQADNQWRCISPAPAAPLHHSVCLRGRGNSAHSGEPDSAA